MKFLVDECTGIWVSKQLKQMNHDSVSVIECMKGAEDGEIVRRAIEEERIIITSDKDFGRLAGFYKPPGIVLLRLKDERTENKLKMISYIIESYGERILGNVTVVSEKKIRMRHISKI